jgi:hypothetical protein
MPERNDISPLAPPAPLTAPAPEPSAAGSAIPSKPAPVREIGGASGPDPTRYGDWERAGRCIDF